MLFAKRRWALRVTERMGLPPRDPAAVELVDMLISGAKMYKNMMRGTPGVKISEPELVLMACAAMTDNRSAFDRLRREGFNAEQLLVSARSAGRALAVEAGYSETVARFYGSLPEVSTQALGRKPTPQKEMANFHRQMVEECLAEFRRRPPDTRQGIVRDLVLTYLQFDDADTSEKRATALQGINAFAQQKKRDAAKQGCASPDNVMWNVSSCMEWITSAEIAAMKTQEVAEDAAAIRGTVQTFITENATPADLAHMQAHMRSFMQHKR